HYSYQICPPKPSTFLFRVGVHLQVVVTNIDTTWLFSVADKVFALISPHTLSRHHKHHDPEDEHHREPGPAKGSGVLVNSAQERFQRTPVHDFLLMCR
uniref:Uncharacterized protein n=1 Tax=Cyprinodon variegatus TaxID=28743 RepID=A0A3Q2GQE6_CYPVA